MHRFYIKLPVMFLIVLQKGTVRTTYISKENSMYSTFLLAHMTVTLPNTSKNFFSLDFTWSVPLLLSTGTLLVPFLLSTGTLLVPFLLSGGTLSVPLLLSTGILLVPFLLYVGTLSVPLLLSTARFSAFLVHDTPKLAGQILATHLAITIPSYVNIIRILTFFK